MKFFAYFYNTTRSSTHDYCPFELLFGKIVNQPDFVDTVQPIYNIDNYAKELKYKLQIAHERARRLLGERKVKAKVFFDKKLQDKKINIEDRVIILDETGHKLDNKYIGPYKVIEINDRNNYILKNNKERKIKVHKSRLKILE